MLGLSKQELEELNREYLWVPKTGSKNIDHRDETKTEDGFIPWLDSSEENEVSHFDSNGMIDCCEKKCLSTLTAFELSERRLWLKQMTKREQDIFLISQLISFKITDKKTEPNKVRTRFHYRFNYNFPLCRNAFLFIYEISNWRLKRLQKLASDGILLPPQHKNKNRSPVHALSQDDINKVKQFVSNYALIHGLPDPGRLRRDTREILLPRSDTYLSIFQSYQNGLKWLEIDSFQGVGYDSFRNIWKQTLPHIKFQSAKTDLCDYCETLKERIRYADSHENLQELINDYNEHYNIASEARQFYNHQIKISADNWKKLPKKEQRLILSNLSNTNKTIPQKACSRPFSMHYSFDFAQQVFYPYSDQQRGKEFFKTARKCQIFGVCAEALPRQVFFLIDESEFFGKGSKMVISLLDAFFHLHGIGETHAHLHADNCTGQNKNNYVMWYLMWRVMNGLHQKITLSFMIPGHTKFAPDRYFGLFKIKYRRSNIDCLNDLIVCVEECTRGKTIPQIYGKHLGLDDNLFEYRDWDKYLAKYFKPIDNILQYHYFSFDSKKPGWVDLQVKPGDKPVSICLLKKKYETIPEPVEYPAIAVSDGLSMDRALYLYKEIRPFVRVPNKRDITCPLPAVII